jgi:hypothetical protein
MSRSARVRSLLLLPALVLASFAAAQLPPSTAWTGSPGIFVGHPRTPGVMREVTGLPANLTVPLPNTPTNGFCGCSSIAVHQPSGDLLIGDIPHGTSPNPVHLWRIQVDTQTLAATVVGTFLLGQTLGINGDVNQIVQLGG